MEENPPVSRFAGVMASLSDSEPEDLFLNPIRMEVRMEKAISRKRPSNVQSTPKKSKKQAIENVFECAICLSNIREKRIGNPSSCQHNFCIECIKRWAKDNSTCPLDRQTFEWINILDRSSGDVIMKIDKDGRRIVESPSDLRSNVCSLCSLSHDPKLMVSCDRCKTSNHIGCLPNIETVSVYSWLCEMCEVFGTSEINENVLRVNSAERGLALQRYRIHLHAKNMKKNGTANNTLAEARSNRLQVEAHEPPPQQPPTQAQPQDLLLEILRSQETMFRSRTRGIRKSAESTHQTSSATASSSSSADASSSSSSAASSSSGMTSSGGRARLLSVEKVAKDILKPYVNDRAITTDKARQILKIVVPKICKETSPSINPDALKQMVQEKVLIWLDIL